MKDTQAPRPFGIKDKFSYMMGDVGCNLLMTLANSYLLIFYTKVMGVTAAVVSTLFMLARFVDAFTDMAVGRFVDTRADKRGDRFRPWIAAFTIPLAVTSSLMYNSLLADSSMTVKVIWLIVTYLLFGSVCYTAVNIPYGAMANVISDNPDERASLSTWRNVGSQIGGLILGIVAPMVIYVKDAEGNSIASGSRFMVMASVLAVLSVICLFICWKGSVERIRLASQQKKEKSASGNTWSTIRKCLTDKPIMMCFLGSIFLNTSMSIFMSFNQYMFLDYFGNTGLSGLASIVLFLGFMSTAPFAVPLSRRFGKKEIGVAGMLLSAVTYAAMWISHLTNPYLYFIGVFLAFFGLGMFSMVGGAVNADTVDNHYLETGDRVDGTVYAMNSFMRKIAGALTTGAVGWCLTFIHYEETAAVQTQAVKSALFNVAMAIPTICFALSAFFFFLYPLNKKKVEEIHARMKEVNEK